MDQPAKSAKVVTMAEQKVLLGGAIFSVPRRLLAENYETFWDNPDLLRSPYRVHSAVGDDALRAVFAAVDGSPPELTEESVNELLSQVSDFQS
jgi:hypothetical protein